MGFVVATQVALMVVPVLTPGCSNPQRAQHSSTSTSVKSAAELFDEGRTSEALASLSADCNIKSDGECARRIAQAWDTLGEPEQAIAVLRAADKTNPITLANLLSLTLKVGDFQAAGELARKIASTGQLTEQILDDVGLALGFVDPLTLDASLARLKPSNQIARLRGVATLASGNPRLAVNWLRQATTDTTATAETWYLLGIAHRAVGDKSSAQAAFRRASEMSPGSLDATIALAGLDPAAFAILDSKQAMVRERPGFWYATAQNARKQGNLVASGIAYGYALYYDGLPLDAEAKWSSLLPLAKDDDRRELFAALFNSAYKRQDSPKAQMWVERALAEFKDDMWFRKRRAEVLIQQNRLQEATRQMVDIVPSRDATQGAVSEAELSDLKCRILLDSGDQRGFQTALETYLKVAPDAGIPYLMRGEAALAGGRQVANLKDALSAYKAATLKAPTDPEAWASRGTVEAELGLRDEAANSLYQALSLWPRVQDGTPHLKLVSLLGSSPETKGLRDFHANEYRRLRTLKDGWPTSLKLLRSSGTGKQWLTFGRAALDRHENWYALCAFQQATKLLPKDPVALRGLASARWRNGWYIAALDATLRANRLNDKK